MENKEKRRVYSVYIITQIYVELGILPTLTFDEHARAVVADYDNTEAIDKCIKAYYADESVVNIKNWIESHKLIKNKIFTLKDAKMGEM